MRFHFAWQATHYAVITVDDILVIFVTAVTITTAKILLQPTSKTGMGIRRTYPLGSSGYGSKHFIPFSASNLLSFCSNFYVDVLENINLLHIFVDLKTVFTPWYFLDFAW